MRHAARAIVGRWVGAHKSMSLGSVSKVEMDSDECHTEPLQGHAVLLGLWRTRWRPWGCSALGGVPTGAAPGGAPGLLPPCRFNSAALCLVCQRGRALGGLLAVRMGFPLGPVSRGPVLLHGTRLLAVP